MHMIFEVVHPRITKLSLVVQERLKWNSIPVLIQASRSEFVEMFVGVGASRIRNLFSEVGETSAAIPRIEHAARCNAIPR